MIFFVGLNESIVQKRPSIPPSPEIAFIAIREGYQKFGIGTQLVTYMNTLLRTLGYSVVVTKTANPHAKRMYEKRFGARTVSMRRVFNRSYWQLSWKTDNSSF